MTFRCADCGIQLGFDPSTLPGARILRYHHHNVCSGRTWALWREQRRRERSRRQAGAVGKVRGRAG